MSKAHVVHDGWVRTSYLSKKFDLPDAVCGTCGRWLITPLWFHMESEKVLCVKCWERDVGWWK